MAESVNIRNLPSEVLEFILNFVSPYEDYKNCMLVCKEWRDLVQEMIKRKRTSFVRDVKNMNVVWFHHAESSFPTIAARFGHSCCRYKDSMFVFGGYASTNTTFNDLWRLDLNSRRWIRPLAVGTYPPPKAFATFLPHNDVLVLFGGLAHPSTSALHQFQDYRLFNQLHFYDPQANQWIEMTTMTNPPAVAGHSASIHGDLMVVFGGRQLSGGRYNICCNDIWVLDLRNLTWWKQETGEVKPPPMRNQTQISIDDDHALVIGGCGFNTILSDVWLLTIGRNLKLWTWTKMTINNRENSTDNHLFNPACKVQDKVVFLGRGPQAKSPALNQMIRIHPRTWVPPREEDVILFGPDNLNDGLNGRDEKRKLDVELCVNGRRGLLPIRNRTVSNQSVDQMQQLNGADVLPSPSPSCSKDNINRTTTEKMNIDGSCGGGCSSFSDECNNEESVKCSICGKVKLFSTKRIKTDSISSYESSSTESVDSSGWCHCSTTSEENSRSVGGNSERSALDSSTDSLGGASSSSFLDSTCSSSSSPLHQNCSSAGSSNDASSSSEESPSSLLASRNTAMPSIRMNATSNRQKQLEGFRRMEERIRNMMRPSSGAVQPGDSSKAVSKRLAVSTRKPMFIYVLDTSKAIALGEVEWLPVQNQSASDGPEETAFFSLIQGRGELVMFGGIQNDSNSRNQGPHYGRNTVSNRVYVLTSKPKTF